MASTVVIAIALDVVPVAAASDGAAAPPALPRSGVAVSGKRPPALLPNLRAVQAKDLTIQRVDGRRWLRFTSALANVGPGPLEVRPDNQQRCPRRQRHARQILYLDVDRTGHYRRAIDTRIRARSAGCMVFHPSHHHWHFNSSARYTIIDPKRHRVVASHPKTSFCLRDSRRVPSRWGVTTRFDAYYGACDRDTKQGISIGWADVYESYLPGQALPLPR
ncbi:MAG TPA: lysyl oxidase family protein, partial [Nocardioidaceae bacterium]